VPPFLQPLDGNASDQRALLEAVSALTQHLQDREETPGVSVAARGLDRAENLAQLNQAGVRWVSRVPAIAAAAQAIVQERLPSPGPPEPRAAWQRTPDGTRHWWSREVPDLPQGPERWIVVRTQEGKERARATLQRQTAREPSTWEQRRWHLRHQTFACQPDAEAALAKTCQRLPAWFMVQAHVSAHPTSPTRGRPRQDALPTAAVWQIQATLSRDPVAVEREVLRRAAFIMGTHLVDTQAWPDAVVSALYRAHTVAERGCAFLNDPLFLAASVFVKKPERILAIAFVMGLCLLVYQLAEVRVRQRLTATGHTVPDPVRKPTAHPTLRWLFPCFAGIDLHHTRHPDGTRSTAVLRLTALHRLVLHLLGPAYANCYVAF
jgi:transposase